MKVNKCIICNRLVENNSSNDRKSEKSNFICEDCLLESEEEM